MRAGSASGSDGRTPPSSFRTTSWSNGARRACAGLVRARRGKPASTLWTRRRGPSSAPDGGATARRMGAGPTGLQEGPGRGAAGAVKHPDVRRDLPRAVARHSGAGRRSPGSRGGDPAQTGHAAVHRRKPVRPLHTLRRARARHGCDDERHGRPPGRRALRRHLPRLLGLHAACHAVVGDDVAAGDLGLQPRFHRHRDQRPDTPAGGIPAVAARHPESLGDAAV